MYQSRYEDIVDEGSESGREREIVLFDRCIGLLQAARSAAADTPGVREAVVFTRRFWAALIEDLGLADNALPKETRASLISVGLFVLKEIDKLANGEPMDFDAVIDVSQAIRNGLSAGQAGS